MKQKIEQLLSIKSLVTLGIVGTFCGLTISIVQSFINTDNDMVKEIYRTFVSLVSMIMCFYFGTIHEKKG